MCKINTPCNIQTCYIKKKLYYIITFTKFLTWYIPVHIFINTHTHTHTHEFSFWFIGNIHTINLICCFSGIFFCQVQKNIVIVFSVFNIRLFKWNQNCSSFITLLICCWRILSFPAVTKIGVILFCKVLTIVWHLNATVFNGFPPLYEQQFNTL